MGKTITLAPWAGPAKMTCHPYTNTSGNNYDCYNIKTGKIRSVIAWPNNDLADICKSNEILNRYSPFHPGNKVVNGTTKILELSEPSTFAEGSFAGYMHSAEEPYVITNEVTFTAAGTVNFVLAFDLGDVDWPEDSALSTATHVHIFNDNGTTAIEANHIGSAEILSSNPLVISCSDDGFSAANTSRTYYAWFGGSSASVGKIWRPVNNSAAITFTYLAPSYLRRCYFDCTGVANSTIGLGAYTKDTYADQSVDQASDTYTAAGVVPWYLQTSPSQPVQLTTGNVDFYARKNDGAWQQISTRQNVAVGDPIIVTGAALPFTINQYSDVVDILIRVAGQTLTPANQGYCAPSDGEPG